jgi:hypothetical protein
MANESVYIDIGQDLPEVLQDSEKLRNAIRQEFKNSGIEAEIEWQPNPTSTGPDREVVLSILAVGAASMMIGNAVKRVIDAHNRGNPTVVTEKELIPALDKNGNPIRDKAGNPVFTSREVPKVYNSKPESDATYLKAATIFEFRSGAGISAEQGKST